MKQSKILICLGIILLLIVLSVSVFGDSKTYNIRLAYQQAPLILDSPEHNAALAFKAYVESNSSGRIKVKLYPAGSLGNEKDVIEGISAGRMELQLLGSGTMALYLPECQIFGIPYLFPNEYVAWRVLDSNLVQELSNLLVSRHQIRILAIGEEGGFAHTTNSKRPLKSAADWKGIKMRTMESKLQMEMVKALGGNPTPISWTEIYTSLKTGVADGQMNPIPVILSSRLQEVQKYLTLDCHAYGEMYIIASEKWLRRLPQDLQKVIIDGGKLAAVTSRGTSRLKDATGLEELAQKMEIYTPTAEEMATFRSISQKPIINWLQTQIDKKWITRVLNEVNKASK